MPVIKLNHPERDAAPLARALCAGGVPVAEVTFRAAGAATAIRLMAEACPDMLVGAGTVLTTGQVDEALAAGAKFIVTPGLDPEIVKYCQSKNLPIYPGCTTPTDYHAAYKLGLEVLKFFPAEQSGGLAKIKAMSAPFPMFNVAVSLANYGLDAAYVTKLPAHAIGQAAVNSLRRYGVDTSMIVRGGDRVGIYFNEKGASQRGSVCIYDRAHSAIQEATTADFDWDKIFDGVDWFHFTGITPALGPNVVEICKEACKAAKAKGVKISCDLNYRGKLWTREQARAAMTDLCQYVDVCISNEEDAKDVFGIEAEATDIYAGEINREGYKSVAKQLADKFGFEKVAITLRESHSAFDNGWSAMLYDVASGEYCFSKKYDLHIIDRVGGGDSFGGGLIYSLLTGKSTQAAVEFAVAASALKHSIEGDYNMVTVAEVEKLAGGDGSGRIQR